MRPTPIPTGNRLRRQRKAQVVPEVQSTQEQRPGRLERHGRPVYVIALRKDLSFTCWNHAFRERTWFAASRRLAERDEHSSARRCIDPYLQDIRDSTTSDIAAQLRRRRGPTVSVRDLKAMDNFREPFLNSEDPTPIYETCHGVRAVLVRTEREQLRRPEPSDLDTVPRRQQIIGGRIRLDSTDWQASHWLRRAIGRSSCDSGLTHE